jgi:hypothetical protein
MSSLTPALAHWLRLIQHNLDALRKHIRYALGIHESLSLDRLHVLIR